MANEYKRREFMAQAGKSTAALFAANFFACSIKKKPLDPPPNFLLLMSDNHYWGHLGCNGDPVVRTPNIDDVARSGVRFTHSFCAAPSCAPARAGLLTGQDIWRLEEAANLWGIMPAKFTSYTELLEHAGYHVGFEGKGWGPGDFRAGGRTRNPAGEQFDSFGDFLDDCDDVRPWCFWLSTVDPHRPYEVGAGAASGKNLAAVEVPGYLPDNDIVRGDICDYYTEVEAFDRKVGDYLQLLEERGCGENTVIVICSDNGWQMPRGLANLYDFGTRIPLIIAMPERFAGGRIVNDFVNLNDLAPTFLELAGLEIPRQMTAKSLVKVLTSRHEGHIDSSRDFVVTARERHAFCRQGGAGYPGRAIRTKDFLYIKNYTPDRWPAGDPPLYGDVDAHMLHYPCPTKAFILQHRDNRDVKPFFDLGFAKRPAEELFDLRVDPDQLKNVAYDPGYTDIKRVLARKLTHYLRATEDPRVVGGALKWEGAEYFCTPDFIPRPSPELRELLGLQEHYSYLEPGM